MKLYIIRHADPDYYNDTITEFGWQEAYALADWLKDLKIDKIYSSPKGRAIATAKPTCELKGMEAEILPWIEESFDYLYSSDLTKGSDCSYSFSVEKGIYDFKDFKNNGRMDRINNLIRCSDEFIASLGYVREGAVYHVERDNDDCIAVFCHGGAGSAWIGHLIGLAPGLSFVPLLLGTTSITTVEFESEDWKKKEYIRPGIRRLGEIPHIYKAGLRVNNV